MASPFTSSRTLTGAQRLAQQKATATVAAKMTTTDPNKNPTGTGTVASGVLARKSGAVSDSAGGSISSQSLGDITNQAQDFFSSFPDFSNSYSSGFISAPPIVGSSQVPVTVSKVPWLWIGVGAVALYYFWSMKK